ncbi:MAG: hypothetical protein IIX40_09655, partial [Alistipes sp.]|nr:hypothetical protein [Alistipes sp.]
MTKKIVERNICPTIFTFYVDINTLFFYRLIDEVGEHQRHNSHNHIANLVAVFGDLVCVPEKVMLAGRRSVLDSISALNISDPLLTLKDKDKDVTT